MKFLQAIQISYLQQDNAVFLPLLIINKITCFLRLLLYSDLYATLIVFVLCGIYNTLSAIVLLFFSNFIHSFGPAGKSIPSQLYLLI